MSRTSYNLTFEVDPHYEEILGRVVQFGLTWEGSRDEMCERVVRVWESAVVEALPDSPAGFYPEYEHEGGGIDLTLDVALDAATRFFKRRAIVELIVQGKLEVKRVES